MNIDSKLFQAFGQEAELPAAVRARLEHSYDEIREVSAKETHRKPQNVKKISRTLLIAAVLISLLTVTALAAYRGSMRYELNEEHETFEYQANKSRVYFSPSLVLSFDAPAESSRYFFQADWLPEEAKYAGSALGTLDGIAYNNVFGDDALKKERQRLREKADAEKQAYYEKYPQALTYAASKNLDAQQQAELERLIDQTGMTEEALSGWYSSMISRETDTEKPYGISLLSPAALYGRDYLLGYSGGEVEILEESETGDWYTLKISVDYQSQERFAFERANYIFRYQLNEGYLLLISGTSDFETLERIADNLRVKELPIPCQAGNLTIADYSVLDLGRG